MSDDQEKPKGPNEDIVRKLLAMNPHLRGEGQSTKDVFSMVSKTIAKEDVPAQKKAAAPKPLRSLSEEIDALIVEHNAALAQITKQRAALKTFAASLEGQGKTARTQACDRVVDVIMRVDPDLTDRRHQVLLEQEKAFLDSIGFSGQKLVEAERKRKK